MKRIDIISIVSFFVISSLWTSTKGQNIFPEAVGFGTESRGAYELYQRTKDPGDLPVVLTVDTLYAGSLKTGTNSGSLEWCITQNYPRIIIFEVGGVIDYRKSGDALTIITNDYINIYGQTAPGKGITIVAHYWLLRVDHILIQHMRFRIGDEFTGSVKPGDLDCITIGNSSNVVVDHCSFSWSLDETINITPEARNVTISNCFVYNPLHYSVHVNEAYPNNPERHGFAVLAEGTNQTFYNNIIYRSQYRNPAIGSNANNSVLINNLMNNPGYTAGMYCAGDNTTYVSNIVNQIEGYEWENDKAGQITSSASNLYVKDNWCKYRQDNPNASEKDLFEINVGAITSSMLSNLDVYLIRNKEELEDYLFDNVGALPWGRDLHDSINLINCLNKVGNFVNSPNDLPARAYNRTTYESVYESETAGNLTNGYDWSTNNQTLTINGTSITLNDDTDNINEVVNHINNLLPSGYVAKKHPYTNYVIIQTIAKGSNVSFTINGEACKTLGINPGTYYGEKGDLGYPNYQSVRRELDLPENPQADSDGDGFTNLEEWISDLDFLHKSGTVIDFNQAPVIQPSTIYITDTTDQVNIGQVIATDPNNDALTYQILSGNTNNWFSIDPATGKINLINPVDITSNITVSLFIKVTDNGEGSLSDTDFFVIEIEHIDEQDNGTSGNDVPSSNNQDNTVPVIVTNYEESVISGTTRTLDASKSFDPNKDVLSFNWIAPDGINMSNTSEAIVSYLVPDVYYPTVQTFVLEVSDGKDTIFKTIDVTFAPYKPNITKASIVSIKSSSVEGNNHPINLIDGNPETYWSASGDDQWVSLELNTPITLSHLKVCFHEMNEKKLRFDVLVSKDDKDWEDVLDDFESCGFSSNMHLVEFSNYKSLSGYKYIKLVGHGTNEDSENQLSELEIFGDILSSSQEELINKELRVYPNPVTGNKFTLELQEADAKVILMSINGQVLLSQQMSQGIHLIDIYDYPKGVYVLSVTFENSEKTISKRIVVQ